MPLKDPSERARYQLGYRIKHRERRRVQAADYRATHPQKVKESFARFRSRNRERLKLQSRIYYWRDPRKALDANARWARANKSRRLSIEHARRVRVNVSNPQEKQLAHETVKKMREQKVFRCYYCRKRFPISKLRIDHVTAIAIGGSHSPTNLASSCIRCNARKWKHPVSQLRFIEQKLLEL